MLDAAWLDEDAHVVPPTSELDQTFLDHAIDYTDKMPDVEVTVDVLKVFDFQVEHEHLAIEFRVTLDWEEPDFREGIHYVYDQRVNGFVLSKWLSDDSSSFNPSIFIDNDIDLQGKEDPKHPSEPRIHRVVTRSTGESVWLTKTYDFNGRVACQSIDARQFPFDIHRVRLEVQSSPQPGVTTLGEERRVRLVDPKLRRLEAFEELEARRGEALKAVEALGGFRGSIRGGRRASTARQGAGANFGPLKADRLETVDLDEVPAHRWRSKKMRQRGDMGERLQVEVGEMRVCAFGGARSSSEDGYDVELVLARDWRRTHGWDFVIQAMLVVVSHISLFVPFDENCIAARLSITLVVILAVVMSSSQRPTVVNELPYATKYDKFMIMLVFMTVAESFANVFVAFQCWGVNRTGLEAHELGHHANFLSPWWCSEGPLGCSQFDSYFLLGSLAVLIGSYFGMVSKAQLKQVRFLKGVTEDVTSYVDDVEEDDDSGTAVRGTLKKIMTLAADAVVLQQPTGKISRNSRVRVCQLQMFVKAEDGSCQFRRYESLRDIALCLSISGMPALRFFPLLWARSALWSKGCCRCRRRRGPEPIPISPEESSKSMSSETDYPLAGGASAQWCERYVGARPLLSRDDPVYLIDIGTGEIGFYKYQWRTPDGGPLDMKPILFCDVSAKLKLENGQSFRQQFVDEANGTKAFAEAVLTHFAAGADDHMWASPRQREAGPQQQKLHALGSTGARRIKILLGPTGQNRQSLLQSGEYAKLMEQWVLKLQAQLAGRLLADVASWPDVILFVPNGHDEATYELVATEWLVQRGDLNVMRVPQGVQGVPFAGMELSQAISRAARKRLAVRGGASGQAPAFATCAPQDLAAEFEDLLDGDLDREALTAKFAAAGVEAGTPGRQLTAEAATEVFRGCPQLMRALIRSRLFNGTLSAGGGSCQITMKPETNLRALKKSRESGCGLAIRTSDFHSVKLGNRTPLLGDPTRPPLWPSNTPMTPELIALWRARIQSEMSTMGLPPKLHHGLRGVYVGISAVFYAAKLAGCSECLLPKAEFLSRLDAKLAVLLAEPPKPKRVGNADTFDHRDFSNLVLVREVLGWVLNDSAWLVCKRSWKARVAALEPESKPSARSGRPDANVLTAGAAPLEPLPEYVATWSLGFFIMQSA